MELFHPMLLQLIISKWFCQYIYFVHLPSCCRTVVFAVFQHIANITEEKQTVFFKWLKIYKYQQIQTESQSQINVKSLYVPGVKKHTINRVNMSYVVLYKRKKKEVLFRLSELLRMSAGIYSLIRLWLLWHVSCLICHK